MACTGLNSISKSGQCTPGEINGIIIFKDKPTDIALESVILEATWIALANVVPNDNMSYVKFDTSEPAEIAVRTETLLGGRTVVLGQDIPASKYSIFADQCALNGIYKNFLNGASGYGYFTTLNGFIIGKLNLAKTGLEAIKFEINTGRSNETADAKAKVDIYIQPQEDYAKVQHSIELPFNFDEIETVTTSYTSSLVSIVDTSVVFDLWECGHIANPDATPATFVITDSSGSNVTILAPTVSGNTYTLPTVALPAGDYTLSYDNTTNSDYIHLAPFAFTVA